MPLIQNPDLGSRAFKADPHPFYAHLRETAPVHRVLLPNRAPAYLVTRYADCIALLKDHERFVKNRLTVSGKSPAWVPGPCAP